jgi:DNA polymerase-3 subunit gamma/tau
MERARVPPRRGTKNGPASPENETPVIGDGDAPRPSAEPYTVVARRYRPQRFEEVVGQDHVVRALRNAIRLNRIAQAYLFCGTRGVGKTTMARIFAKCLNCVKGPTEEPCQVCDICQAIAQGQDVDVIEIDGASNNGVEQVRELRQNAGLRPSRARFKVYYIDEVHMLSTGAFNALLKTLEEPPSHVKFIFATTEANKIPDTVLSRCQRYDLAGITPQLIARTLGEICEHEKVAADAEALQVVARRAAGSLRDAESLLDRLLASGSPRLTVEVVQGLLGTASDERLLDMLEALADHDAATALHLLDQAAEQGVQPSEILGGLLDFLRDAMVLSLGADSILLAATPRQKPRLQALIERFPVDAILAALQILDQHRTRLRGSLHGRLLVEMALVRVARLEDLESLDNLVERLNALETGGPPMRRPEPGPARARGVRADGAGSVAVASPGGGSGSPAAPRAAADRARAGDGRSERAAVATAGPARAGSPTGKAVTDPAPKSPPAAEPRGEAEPFDLAVARRIWHEVKLPAKFNWRLSEVEPVAFIQPDLLVVSPRPGSAARDEALFPDEMMEALGAAIQRLTHHRVRVRFESSGPSDGAPTEEPAPVPRRADTLTSDPLVQKVVELFEARPIQMDYDGPDAGASA